MNSNEIIALKKQIEKLKQENAELHKRLQPECGNNDVWKQQDKQVETEIDKNLFELLNNKEDKEKIKILKKEYKNLSMANYILNDYNMKRDDLLWKLQSETIPTLQTYGVLDDDKEMINELKKMFRNIGCKNLVEAFNTLYSKINDVMEENLDLEDKNQGYLDDINELGQSNMELYHKLERCKQDIKKYTNIIKGLENQNKQFSKDAEEYKEKYEIALNSKITDLTTGKYDKMKKYSKNISSKINKKPLNQKRKRGF